MFFVLFFWLMEVAGEILLLLRSLLWPAVRAGCHRSPVRCSRAATTVMLSDFHTAGGRGTTGSWGRSSSGLICPDSRAVETSLPNAPGDNWV